VGCEARERGGEEKRRGDGVSTSGDAFELEARELLAVGEDDNS
jgi:hypothetical protein